MLTKILDRLFVVAGALLFFQVPLFMHQYQLQLTGHVNELQWQVQMMQKTAEQSGKTIDQYIKKFTDNSDRDFSGQGIVMKRVYMRFQTLSKSLDRLQMATVMTKPFYFIYYLQWDIAKSTLLHFQPGLSFTIDGLIYALLGMLFGYLIFTIAMHLMARMRKSF